MSRPKSTCDWLLMIGWFLANAAATSYQQVVIKDLLKGISARDLMRSHFETVTAQLRVADFIDSYLLQSSQLLWPVIEDNRLIGLVTLAELPERLPQVAAALEDGRTYSVRVVGGVVDALGVVQVLLHVGRQGDDPPVDQGRRVELLLDEVAVGQLDDRLYVLG